MMESKKTLCILLPSLGSGGAEKVMSLLLTRLVDDYSVHLCFFFKTVHYRIPEGVTVHFFSEKAFLSQRERLLLFPKIIVWYLDILRKTDASVSLSFLTLPNFINGLVKLKFRNVRTVISERNYPSLEYRSSPARYRLYRKLIPLLYNRADRIFSNSEHINLDLKENFGVTKQMDVIYNPILLNSEFKKNARFNGQDTLKLIHVGRLIPVKNHSMILKALSALQVPCSIDFVGEGELHDELKNETGQLHIEEKVNFVGNVKEVHPYLVGAECFVFSSLSEGFPNALLEAMAAGLPVISSDCKSGPLELINDNIPVRIPEGGFAECRHGILVNVNDSVGMAAAIEYLYHHPYKLAQYGQKSRQRAKDFGLDKIYQKFNTVLGDN